MQNYLNKRKQFIAYLAVLNEDNILYRKEDAIQGLITIYEEQCKEIEVSNKQLKNSIPVKKIEEKIKDINEKLIFATMQANIKDMEKYAYQQMICNELIKENTESEE